jgi:hypothetical protein
MTPSIDIQGIWLRRDGDRLRVLAQVDGVWRIVIETGWPSDGAGLVSICAEPTGARAWPRDTFLEAVPMVKESVREQATRKWIGRLVCRCGHTVILKAGEGNPPPASHAVRGCVTVLGCSFTRSIICPKCNEAVISIDNDGGVNVSGSTYIEGEGEVTGLKIG